MAHLDSMYASLYPEVDMVVMIQVKAIDDEGASVSLLEFNNIEGRIPEPSCHSLTVVGRIEPVLVCGVNIFRDDEDKHRVSISLSRSRISEKKKDIQTCELRYINSKHVQTILRKVAMTLNRSDLLGIDNLTLLPSYEILTCSAFLDTIPHALRAALVGAIHTTTYDSWRKNVPIVVFPSSLVQKLGFCWAIALVRQFEAVLKLKNMLAMDKFLSIQDLINQTSLKELSDEGDLDELSVAANILVNQGVVLENDCPLTFALPTRGERNRRRVTGTKYKAMSVAVADDSLGNEYIKSRLDNTPLAATVVWFASYKEANPKGFDIYKPTDEEWKKYLADPYDDEFITHTMLLTGWGVDEHGIHYWEFQDSYGDVNNGDRGFLRFVQYPGLILEFVELEV